jgi:LysM repeat protein
MVEIKDEDILEVHKLEDKSSGDKTFHGVLRQGEKIMVVYERNSGDSYSGFQEKFHFDLSKLTERQIQFLQGKGYDL